MSSFINKEGKTFHPFIADVLPVGAEDIHHPETREFIGKQWNDFANTFETLTEVERVTRLQSLIKDWESGYLAKLNTAAMSGMMLEIRNLAARSSLTAWLARQPTPTPAEVGNFYANLLRYSADIMGGHTGPVYRHPGAGDVTPHLAFAAMRMAKLHPEDTVRVIDAGDGLLATFADNSAHQIEYVESYPLRRAIFNQMFPQLETVTAGSGVVDVQFTPNTEAIQPDLLLYGVHPGGRLVIYGDRDWHHISAQVISKLNMYRSVDAYATSLPSTLDEGTQALHLQLFTAWKQLNKQIRGTLKFKGNLSTYQSESGVVIVIDNLGGTHTHYEELNLANPQARPFANYITSFDKIRTTRYAPRREIIAHHKRVAEQQRKADAEIVRATHGGTILPWDVDTGSDKATLIEETAEFPNRESQIQQICTELGITTLIHFTRTENLQGILQEGLLGRRLLEARGQQPLFNDPSRIDGHKEAVCLSISFPNYQLFSKFSRSSYDSPPDYSQWIVLLLDPRVLWELDCAFCQENAARKAVSSIPLVDRRKPAALKGIFEDFYNIRHQDLSIPQDYPTHPQAEVLVFDPIPVRYIKAIHFWNADAQARWLPSNTGTDYETSCTNRQYFKPRPDYEVWRPANFDNEGIPLSYTAENNMDDIPLSATTDDEDDIPF